MDLLVLDCSEILFQKPFFFERRKPICKHRKYSIFLECNSFFLFSSEPDTDDSPAFTDDESIVGDDDKTGNQETTSEGLGSQQPQKKTVAQIMRDKKKQTGMTLQW